MAKTNRYLIFLFVIPLFSFGQSPAVNAKVALVEIYTQAISDFIKNANQKNKSSFDTLFFGKRKNGQSDDFPDINLPETIQHTHIRLISPEVGAAKQKERPSRIYINMIGWIEKDNAEFLFYVFSKGFAHQYNYSLNYVFDAKRKEFEVVKVQYKEPPFAK